MRAPRRRPGGGGRRARPPAGRGRPGPSSCPGRAPRSTRPSSSPGAASRWPTTRCPARVEVVDALPLNASGKVLKYVLRDGAPAADAGNPDRGGEQAAGAAGRGSPDVTPVSPGGQDRPMADLLSLSSRIIDSGVADEPTNRVTQELSEVGRRRRGGRVVQPRGGLRAPTTAWSCSTPAPCSPGARVVEALRSWSTASRCGTSSTPTATSTTSADRGPSWPMPPPGATSGPRSSPTRTCRPVRPLPHDRRLEHGHQRPPVRRASQPVGSASPVDGAGPLPARRRGRTPT